MRLKLAVMLVAVLVGFALLVGLAVTRDGGAGWLSESTRTLSLRMQTYGQAFRALLLKMNLMK